MSRRWALVTGASSGIGRALALRLAEAGYNLVAVARDEERLKALAGQCRERHGTETWVLTADLSRLEASAEIENALRGRGITPSLLVNNAGFGVHGRFDETPLERELALLGIAVSGVVDLTKRLLPAMIAARSGGILNVGSVYGFCPVPYQAVYSASKSFLLSFSLAMARELEGTGVTVTYLAPGITRTEFRARAGLTDSGRLGGMEPAEAAEAAYRGFQAGRLIVVPGKLNRAFVAIAAALPWRLKTAFVAALNRLRGLKKT